MLTHDIGTEDSLGVVGQVMSFLNIFFAPGADKNLPFFSILYSHKGSFINDISSEGEGGLHLAWQY